MQFSALGKFLIGGLSLLTLAVTVFLASDRSRDKEYLGYRYDKDLFKMVAAPEIRDATTLVDLYPENWSEAVLFGPYTRSIDIERALDGAWSTERLASDDSIVLVVFLDEKGKVLHNGALPSALVRGHGLGGRRHLRVTRGDSSARFFRDPNSSVQGEVAWVVKLPEERARARGPVASPRDARHAGPSYVTTRPPGARNL